MAIILPRAVPQIPPEIEVTLAKAPCLGRLCHTRAVYLRVKTIVGEFPFPGLGLERQDIPYVLDRLELKLAEGRLPSAGEPEAAVTRTIARNKGLKLGSILLDPSNPDDYAPVPVKVVGILDGPQWFALFSAEFLRPPLFRDVSEVMLLADQPGHQRVLDDWIVMKTKGSPVHAFTYEELMKDTERDLETLYKILNIAIGALVTVLATMMGMLSNIHFSQRMVEYGLLQAVGYSRGYLLKRTVWEIVVVVLFAWLIGIVLSHFALDLVRTLVMDPKGYVMETSGWNTYRYTLFVPAAIGLFGMVTVWWRFRTFDPVAIVERRAV
jgi:hypothetical protein